MTNKSVFLIVVFVVGPGVLFPVFHESKSSQAFDFKKSFTLHLLQKRLAALVSEPMGYIISSNPSISLVSQTAEQFTIYPKCQKVKACEMCFSLCLIQHRLWVLETSRFLVILFDHAPATGNQCEWIGFKSDNTQTIKHLGKVFLQLSPFFCLWCSNRFFIPSMIVGTSI